MNSQKIIYWLPRILSVGFVLYLSVFALDVFGAYRGWALVTALLMHLLPSLVFLFLIIMVWKKDLSGAALFFIIAIGYVLLAGLHRPWSWYIGISGPAVVVAILYVISWRQGQRPVRRGV